MITTEQHDKEEIEQILSDISELNHCQKHLFLKEQQALTSIKSGLQIVVNLSLFLSFLIGLLWIYSSSSDGMTIGSSSDYSLFHQFIEEMNCHTNSTSHHESSTFSIWQDYYCFISMQSIGLTMDAWVEPANISIVIVWIIIFHLCIFCLLKSWWMGYLLYLYTTTIIQCSIAIYQVFRTAISMTAYLVLKLVVFLFDSVQLLKSTLFVRNSSKEKLLCRLKQAQSYEEWKHIATAYDIADGKDTWMKSYTYAKDEHFDCLQLAKNMKVLLHDLHNNDLDHLLYFLSSFVKRNKLGIDSPQLHLECKNGTKSVIEMYTRNVVHALELVADMRHFKDFSKKDRIILFKKLKRSYGSTALCLSGGGSLAMYHMGTVKALLEADLLPNVISGSSGGSIVAAMAACKSNEELIRDVCTEDISTRFLDVGIRWFPPLINHVYHFFKTGFLVGNDVFERTCKFYYSEPLNEMDESKKIFFYTFQDAYEKTGRHVSITVSASEVTGTTKGHQKLLLNHINTPHVFLWSAVAVSCSLPGIMEGNTLMARNSKGETVPYVSLGTKWVDGSVQDDLPMNSMSTCFQVTNFIVSQVNPPVVPFLSKDIDQPNLKDTFFHTVESIITRDVRHRLSMLSFLGLFPRIYGHDFGKMVRQTYVGQVTIVPNFIFSESIGLKAILNPTVEDMKRYISNGSQATYPKLAFIRHLCEIEKCLDKCMDDLQGTKSLNIYQNWLHPSRQDKSKCHKSSS